MAKKIKINTIYLISIYIDLKNTYNNLNLLKLRFVKSWSDVYLNTLHINYTIIL